MKILCMLAALIWSGTSFSQSINDFVRDLRLGSGARFEATQPMVCSDGGTPNLQGLYQYSSDWTFGKATTAAPFIWLGEDAFGQPKLSVSSGIRVDWVFCDEDGDTFERQTSFYSRGVYDLSGDQAAPTIRLDGYLMSGSGQRTPAVLPWSQSPMLQDLSDFDVYGSGQIDGPSDEPLYFQSPRELNLTFHKFEDGAERSIQITFKGVCNDAQDLSLRFTPSTCDNGWCNEGPFD